MPIYEYSCSHCGEVSEVLVLRRSDEAEVACKACGSRGVSRQMSRPAAARTGGSDAPSAGPACGPVG